MIAGHPAEFLLLAELTSTKYCTDVLKFEGIISVKYEVPRYYSEANERARKFENRKVMTIPISSRASLDVPSDARSDISDGTSSTNDGGDDGWEDIEPEDESQSIIGLFSDDIYPDVRSLLKDTKERYNFDLAKVQKDLGVYSKVCCAHGSA